MQPEPINNSIQTYFKYFNKFTATAACLCGLLLVIPLRLELALLSPNVIFSLAWPGLEPPAPTPPSEIDAAHASLLTRPLVSGNILLLNSLSPAPGEHLDVHGLPDPGVRSCCWSRWGLKLHLTGWSQKQTYLGYCEPKESRRNINSDCYENKREVLDFYLCCGELIASINPPFLLSTSSKSSLISPSSSTSSSLSRRPPHWRPPGCSSSPASPRLCCWWSQPPPLRLTPGGTLCWRLSSPSS